MKGKIKLFPFFFLYKLSKYPMKKGFGTIEKDGLLKLQK